MRTLDASVLHEWALVVLRHGLVHRGTPYRVVRYELGANQRGAWFYLEGAERYKVYRQCNVRLERIG